MDAELAAELEEVQSAGSIGLQIHLGVLHGLHHAGAAARLMTAATSEPPCSYFARQSSARPSLPQMSSLQKVNPILLPLSALKRGDKVSRLKKSCTLNSTGWNRA